MITEASVTIELRKHLVENGWEILAFDFPQSGTGLVLKPDGYNAKVKGAIIPDIVAVKGIKGILFENKDRFNSSDFKKIELLRTTDLYKKSLSEVFGGAIPEQMWYGIAFPHISYQIEKAMQHLEKIDILVTVSADKEIRVIYSNPDFIF